MLHETEADLVVTEWAGKNRMPSGLNPSNHGHAIAGVQLGDGSGKEVKEGNAAQLLFDHIRVIVLALDHLEAVLSKQ